MEQHCSGHVGDGENGALGYAILMGSAGASKPDLLALSRQFVQKFLGSEHTIVSAVVLYNNSIIASGPFKPQFGRHSVAGSKGLLVLDG